MKAHQLNLGACALLLVAMVGCAPDAEQSASDTIEEAPPPEVAGEGPGRDVRGLTTLGGTWTERVLPYHGGTGGAWSPNIAPTAVIYGIYTRSGAEVDGLSFAWYQPSGADNLYRQGDAIGTTSYFGGTGGGANGWWTCPVGKGVIGFHGRSGNLLDRIGVICGDVNHPDPTSSLNAQSPEWGGMGGAAFGWGSDNCALGNLMGTVGVRSGTRIDGVQGVCISAH